MTEPHADPSPDSVARHLGIDREAAARLPRFVVEAHPRRARRRGPRSQVDAALMDEILAPYARDVAAGIPDAMIARKAGVTAEQVSQWRQRHRLAGRRGRTSLYDTLHFEARTLLGQPLEPVPHEVAQEGRFKLPAYVLRVPLDYTAFVGVVRALRASGMHPARVAAGIGIDVGDVLVAERYAARGGRR